MIEYKKNLIRDWFLYAKDDRFLLLQSHIKIIHIIIHIKITNKLVLICSVHFRNLKGIINFLITLTQIVFPSNSYLFIYFILIFLNSKLLTFQQKVSFTIYIVSRIKWPQIIF